MIALPPPPPAIVMTQAEASAMETPAPVVESVAPSGIAVTDRRPRSYQRTVYIARGYEIGRTKGRWHASLRSRSNRRKK